MTGQRAEEARERADSEERAELIRDGFRKMPGFVDLLRKSQEDEAAGRLVSHDDIKRKYQIED